MNDNIQTTKLAGVYVLKQPVFADDRGFFQELYRKSELEAVLGFAFEPVQWNHSRSKKGTLRGIHIAPWHKLVSLAAGTAQQIVVDTRPDSPTFSQYVSIDLGEDNWNSVFLPAGCGNAFLATSDIADYMYFVTDYWAAGKEITLKYNDPNINVAWQINSPLLSERDLQGQTLRQAFPSKFQ